MRGHSACARSEFNHGKNIHAEIGEVLARLKPGRTGAGEVTLYKSVGIAIQDVATATLVYDKALERKVGTNVEV